MGWSFGSVCMINTTYLDVNLGVLWGVLQRNLQSTRTIFMWTEYYMGSFRRVYGDGYLLLFLPSLGLILLTSGDYVRGLIWLGLILSGNQNHKWIQGLMFHLATFGGCPR